ncbi:FAD-linked oxidoreductase-like protein [Ochromonadaceae sp. CCMP2298]|nr:FAD-linked oxidoreductase-like protein [Ochromonadaceae sp. CCMP2298]|mmetsp:Transcript_4347/g.9743  ORF Transcript_4347/g.9743 Transcript_4347/m.9743 type:complete len:651 (-) Transcript_4347:286-2238(-)
MVKIIDKIRANTQEPFFSFEFFPPKTEAGVENLYQRMDRMTSLQPLFVDITWGAGGCTKDLTMAICEYTQTYFGIDALMHLTCTNLTIGEIKRILQSAREAGIQNILALRGDPPKGAIAWEPTPGGCETAIDLVRLIRKEHGDYFCIAVAGFPEGHPQSNLARKSGALREGSMGGGTASASCTIISGAAGASEDAGAPGSSSGVFSQAGMEQDLQYLKQKVEAGADFVLTQFFYEPQVFVDFQTRCLELGLSCPIIPGMMPIQSYSSFKKMTSFCRTRVPEHIWQSLEPMRDNDEEVKEYGVRLCKDICDRLSQHGTRGFHFYTLNLEKSVLAVLRELGVQDSVASRRAFPWRGSRSNLKGLSEEVRPINWANRPKSYIKRTITWDEFPNGRWGDNRSPAFGELSDSHFFRPVEGSREDLLAMWGEAPITPADVYEVFARYVEGKIPILPWCESALNQETIPLQPRLAAINRQGFLSINSQPAVNGERSSHPVYGWGGVQGRVYQKAYIEFFASPALVQSVLHVAKQYPSLSLYAINSSGAELTTGVAGVTALTWGVFPNREILQPTVFDHDSFVVWSEEVFQLWTKSWASLYDDETDSSALLYSIHDSYYLVAIIDNDYVESGLFDIFEEIVQLRGEDLDHPAEPSNFF